MNFPELITELYIYRNSDSYLKICDKKITDKRDKNTSYNWWNKWWDFKKKQLNSLKKASLTRDIIITDCEYLRNLDEIVFKQNNSEYLLHFLGELYENHQIKYSSRERQYSLTKFKSKKFH